MKSRNSLVSWQLQALHRFPFPEGQHYSSGRRKANTITPVTRPVSRNQFNIFRTQLCFIFIKPIPLTSQFIHFFRYQLYILKSHTRTSSNTWWRDLFTCLGVYSLQAISKTVWLKTGLQLVGCPVAQAWVPGSSLAWGYAHRLQLQCSEQVCHSCVQGVSNRHAGELMKSTTIHAHIR